MSPDRGIEREMLEPNVLTPTLESLNLADKSDDSNQTSELVSEESISIPAHLSHDPSTNAKTSEPFQFGQRHLSESDDVFSFNAWDHVVPDESHYEYCESQYASQRATPVSDFDRNRFNEQPEKWWNLFYKEKTSTFFKDRKWLMQEFPVLKEVTQAHAGEKVVLEVGAGAGNTAFPLLRLNENPNLRLHAVDFSKKAVETMTAAEEYSTCDGIMSANVWDVAGEELPIGVEEGSVDIVIMIFIFSALNPKQWEQAVCNIHRVLKPGGQVLFRDYGRGDLAQVRFKAKRWMSENFYVRGDGTRVYFFELDELERIWDVRFEISNLDVDRRLIVNRQRRIKMYRCWIQGRFCKKELSTA
ncbi:hypothetical protein LTR84_009396 [Exophiala bonariae]|uniref:tRNA N(3)-methylcytidine methyltransferase n=1 Tax=Exophiala bonariae TaxID=1690606 RepID=A0AAV9MXF0_9EURO|nr:hypothetical protein LTR84_009396 [Exophiala bonariae]